MARLLEKEYTYFQTVRGMCAKCRQVIPARVFFKDNHVWQQGLCPNCTNTPVQIADDISWYLSQTLRARPDHSPLAGAKAGQSGCPQDCGPCTWHASPNRYVTIHISSNNKENFPVNQITASRDHVQYRPVEEIANSVNWLLENSDTIKQLAIAGSEPMNHPDIFKILRICCNPRIERIVVHSSGIPFDHDYCLCERLADMDVDVIFQFNSFDSNAGGHLHDRDIADIQQQAINNLGRANINVILLYKLIANINENVLGGLLDLIWNNESIRALTVQPVSHVRNNHNGLLRLDAMPVDLAAKKICELSCGRIAFSDFVPDSFAHSLCSLKCVLFKNGTDWSTLAEHGSVKNDISEIRTIHVHALMAKETFDCSRAVLCPDMVLAQPGKLMPSCVYNEFYS
jgi:7,8-dihydro-6-hydroxymethylpterin dimethyltransferase